MSRFSAWTVFQDEPGGKSTVGPFEKVLCRKRRNQNDRMLKEFNSATRSSEQLNRNPIA